MSCAINLAEIRAKCRAKHRNQKPTHTYLFRYREIELEVVRTPCYIDDQSPNYYYITYWDPEAERWGEGSVNKKMHYVEPIL